MFWNEFWVEVRILLGVVVAVILGFAIGYERKCRAKEAGIRTHTIVCAGSALMMIVSKYAFSDMPDFDPARIAAQIVSGVGFLGAGIIVYRKNEIRGLTTAAGVWATAGVGMAAGAEMYVVAIGATIILILIQCLLHIKLKLFKSKKFYRLRIDFQEATGEIERIKEIFGVEQFQNLTLKQAEEGIMCHAVLYTESEFPSRELSKIMKENPNICFIERCGEE